LDKRIKEGQTEVYFYFAGHGLPDIETSKAYLIPCDSDPNYASLTANRPSLFAQRSTSCSAPSVFSAVKRPRPP